MKKDHIIMTVSAALLFFSVGCGNTSQEQPQAETAVSGYHVIAPSAVGSGISEEYIMPGEYMYAVPFPEGMEPRYGYYRLNDSEKEIYDTICNAVKNFRPSVEIPNIDETGALYNRIFELIRTENCGLFYIADRRIGETSIGNQSFSVNFSYKYTPEQVTEMLDKTKSAADRIIGSLPEDADDYTKLKYFHDTLITSCESDTAGEYVNTIYGALADGKALCEGYAKAFSYLCSRAGIENIIVTGDTTTAHMWNMVKLDGNWYHVDVTWDQPDKLLKEHYPDTVLYNYFLVSDSDIEGTRTVNTSLCEPPRATGSVMNYFIHDGMYAETYEQTLGIIESGCRNAVAEKRRSFSIKLSSEELYSEVLSRLSARSGNSRTDISAVAESAGYTGRVSYTDRYSSDRILIFLLDYVD